MAVQYFSLQKLLSLSILLPLVSPFTVITSDSDVPSSALIDGPQPAFSTNQNGARTDRIEQEAVYEIMRATGNDWATEIPDVCRGRWHGIECMPDKENVQHVVSLSFGALSDDTAFPTCDPTRSYVSESITKLPHLRTLFFFRCFSNNPQRIPTFLGRMGPTLQTLVLRDNGFVGRIPSELGNLTRLRILDLHKNSLNGSIPDSLGRLTGLMSLDLSWNKLSGSIPGLSFPALKILDLSQNLLMGPIPSSIGGCQSLIKMDFTRNHLTGSIPESIVGLKDLILMDLSYNRLSGLLPTTFKSLKSLQVLNLKGNPMTTTSLPSNAFDGMKGLMFLILSNMNMHGSIPESIGRLSNLRVIYLDGNRFNGSIPNGFRNLRNLSELRLNDNQLSGPIPLERETVWKMKRNLKLHNNFGLCYNPNSGFEDGLDPSFYSDIGSCTTPTPTPGSTRTVQH